jgi:hypothetical protein
MIGKEEFNILNDYWIFDGVGMSYEFISQFVIIINHISFPCKVEDFRSISTKFHTVSSTPTTNGINVKLWKSIVSCRVHGAKNVDNISKQKNIIIIITTTTTQFSFTRLPV